MIRFNELIEEAQRELKRLMVRLYKSYICIYILLNFHQYVEMPKDVDSSLDMANFTSPPHEQK